MVATAHEQLQPEIEASDQLLSEAEARVYNIGFVLNVIGRSFPPKLRPWWNGFVITHEEIIAQKGKAVLGPADGHSGWVRRKMKDGEKIQIGFSILKEAIIHAMSEELLNGDAQEDPPTLTALRLLFNKSWQKVDRGVYNLFVRIGEQDKNWYRKLTKQRIPIPNLPKRKSRSTFPPQ